MNKKFTLKEIDQELSQLYTTVTESEDCQESILKKSSSIENILIELMNVQHIKKEDKDNVLKSYKQRYKLLKKIFIIHSDKKKNEINMKIRHKTNKYKDSNLKIKSLLAEYENLLLNTSVKINGDYYNILEAEDFLTNKNHKLREIAWERTNEIKNKINPKVENIFYRLLIERHNLASESNFNNYRELSIYNLGQTNNSMTLIQFQNNVVKYLVPIKKTIENNKKKQLNVCTLQPWDVRISESKKIDRTRSFDTLSLFAQMLYKIDIDFFKIFEDMKNKGHIVINYNTSDIIDGFCLNLPYQKSAYIEMNFSKNNTENLFKLAHEFGHALHYIYSNANTVFLKEPNLESAEIASLIFELIILNELKEDSEIRNYNEIKLTQLSEAIYLITSSCLMNEFQTNIYESPFKFWKNKNIFHILCKKYNGVINMEENEEGMDNQWRYSAHLFFHPFYYIEYGLAQVVALKTYQEYKKDKDRTKDVYKYFLTSGKEVTNDLIKNLFKINPTSSRAVRDLALELHKEIQEIVANSYLKDG